MAHTPGDDAELDAAVEAARQALAAANADAPDRWVHLRRLRNALWDRFDQSADPADLSAAVEAARELAAVTVADDPLLADRTANLGILLGMRYEHARDAVDLAAAIAALRKALALTGPDDPDRLGYLIDLWDLLWERVNDPGDLTDLDAAVEVGREVVALVGPDDPDRPRYLSDLRGALHARFDRTGDVADLDAAVEAARLAGEATPTDDPDAPGRMHNLGRVLHARFGRYGDVTDLGAAIGAARQAAQAAPVGDPDRGKYLNQLRSALWDQFERSDAAADLDAVIDAARQAVAATPADHPDRRSRLSNLGYSLRARFRQRGDIADLDDAIAAWRESVEGAASDDPYRARRMSRLAAAFADRFRSTGQMGDEMTAEFAVGWDRWYRQQEQPAQADDDLPATISLFTRYFSRGGDDIPAALLGAVVGRAALAAAAAALQDPSSTDVTRQAKLVDRWQHIVRATPPGHADWPLRLIALAGVLRRRHEITGAPDDLDAAIASIRAAAEAATADPAARARSTAMLAVLLEQRFRFVGQLADLDAAAAAVRAALAGVPSDYPDRAKWLGTLVVVAHDRFERTQTTADLEAEIDALRTALDAVADDHQNRGRYLSLLGRSLQERFERTRVPADLDAAITAMQDALAASPAGQDSRTERLVVLSGLRYERFLRSAEAADLDAAVEAAREAVAEAGADHPDRAAALSHLTVTLRERFDRTGTLADLEGAVEAAEQAMAVDSGGDFQGGRLSNLSSALFSRFERFGAEADINAAVELSRAAADAVPAGDASRGAVLTGLGIALYARFKRTDSEADLDAAIEAGRAAVASSAEGQARRAEELVNLEAALIDRFGRTRTQADLDEAIRVGESAVAESHGGDPHLPGMLCNLAISWYLRFKETGSRADLEAAISAARIADSDVPADHPGRAMILSNLSIMLESRFRLTEDPDDWMAGLEAAEAVIAIDSAPPSIRILNARAAASLAPASRPARAANLLEAAVRLLPEVAPRQLERADQQHAVGRFAGLANDAAARALANTSVPAGQRPAQALRLLESGRSVLLSQALSTRSDLTDLRARAPGLASRYSSLCELLDQDSSTGPGSAGLYGQGQLASPGAARSRERLAAEFAAVVSEIRAIDGLASFGLPPTTGELLAQAAAGPVVSFSVSKQRSDALLLTEDGIRCLELGSLTLAALDEQIDAFRLGLSAAADPDASISGRRHGETRIFQVLAWLWDNAAGPVLDALGYRGPPVGNTPWPRVWWVPGGHLSQLPLHAAGHYVGEPAGGADIRNVMDRVISSYTPTVRALRYAREQAVKTRKPGKSLIVAAPEAAGSRELAGAAAEAAALTAFLPDPVLLAGPDGGSESGPSTRASVLAQLPGSAIVHFACHAETDLVDPSRSRLVLADHDTAPLTIASLAPVRLDNAQLAYLSACRTAITDNAKLADESIHLTSAFQLAGFPHVIGTLWNVEDEAAASTAIAFYRHLASGGSAAGQLDAWGAAKALHAVTLALRDQFPATPSLWAAYTHSGA
jgi:tetratricopeptide (TPR) repeat protein